MSMPATRDPSILENDDDMVSPCTVSSVDTVFEMLAQHTPNLNQTPKLSDSNFASVSSVTSAAARPEVGSVEDESRAFAEVNQASFDRNLEDTVQTLIRHFRLDEQRRLVETRVKWLDFQRHNKRDGAHRQSGADDPDHGLQAATVDLRPAQEELPAPELPQE